MDKQDEALKLLNEIKHINRLIEQLQEQIDITYTKLTNTTQKPKEIQVQTSLPADPMADQVAEIVEYQQQIQEYQLELVQKKSTAIVTLKKMTVENQQIILYRYFKGYTIEQIGETTGYTYRWAWEKLHQAEEEFISFFSSST